MKHELLYERDQLFDVNMIITFTIDITGTLSFNEIENAFQKAVGINEILQTKIVIDSDGCAYYTDNATPKSWIWNMPDVFMIK